MCYKYLRHCNTIGRDYLTAIIFKQSTKRTLNTGKVGKKDALGGRLDGQGDGVWVYALKFLISNHRIFIFCLVSTLRLVVSTE